MLPASLVVPAKGGYTTGVTWDDKTPATDLYGADLGDTILGSGNPRDDHVQYGVNIAVLDKARDGSWGKIAVWNATSLTKLGIGATPTKVSAGKTLTYTLTVRNLSPAPQPFTVRDPMPANTTFLRGNYYNSATNGIEWTGTVGANQTKVLAFSVRVNAGTPRNTVITNSATLTDDGSGSTASAKTTVK